MDNNNEEHMNDNNEKQSNLNDFFINWENIWNNALNDNNIEYVFYPVDFKNNQLNNNIEYVWSTSNNQNINSLYDELMDALEEAVNANFENTYFNDKVEDIYRKINEIENP